MTELVNPLAVVRYLKETGWELYPGKRPYVRIFQRDEGEKFYQVNVPMDKALGDYKEAMYRGICTIADYEGKPLEEVFLYLLNPNTDILKIRMQRQDIEAGSILMDDAINLYENARKLLAAAAQDVLHPVKYHMGRPDGAIADFLSGCRFGQTEIGSYVVSVVCPFAEIDDDTNQYRQLSIFSDEEVCANSLTRKVTNRVMDNLYRIKSTIDDGDLKRLTAEGGENQISANFFEALQGMNLEEDGSELEFSAKWSPVVKNPTGIHGQIRLSHDYYDPMRTVTEQLKGKTKKSTRIVGRIRKLESTPDLDKRKSGVVTVVYVDDSDKARTVTAQLERTDYNKAISAHETGSYVELVGELSGRTRQEIKCDSFSVVG